MKQTVMTLAIVGTILAILAFSNSDDKPIGAIGDVKYSVLPPYKFREENGKGWVLMDNNIPLQGSNLNTKHGITSLPDARGLFIRSLNLKRNDDKADPYSKENNNTERQMGDFQTDAFKLHRHSIAGKLLEASGGIGFYGYGFESNSRQSTRNYSTTEDGGNESRPKNIALYTYIKIN